MADLIIARNMKWISGLLAFLLTFPVYAADPWTQTQKALAVSSVTFQVIDWGQTRDIAKHPGMYQEVNPVVGSHPSVGKVNAICATSIAGNLIIANLLPSKWRTRWLATVTVVEIGFTAHNRQIGLGVSF